MKALVELASKPIVWQEVEFKQSPVTSAGINNIGTFINVSGGNAMIFVEISANNGNLMAYNFVEIHLTALGVKSKIYDKVVKELNKDLAPEKALAEEYIKYWLSVFSEIPAVIPNNWEAEGLFVLCDSMLKLIKGINA